MIGVALLAACKKDPPTGPAPVSSAVVAEALPRCRADAKEMAIPGEDVVVGDAIATDKEIVLGVVRRNASKRVGSIVRMPIDLASVKTIDVAPAFGEEPAPSPRLVKKDVKVAWYTRKLGEDAGAPTTGGMAPGTRTLHVGKLAGDAIEEEGVVVQQADESSMFDVAWPEAGAPLVAWDEDAPIAVGEFLPDRGRVKTTILGAKDPDGGAPKIAVVSPYATDADTPRVVATAKGYVLAWLARRPESTEDAGIVPEGPGEERAFRWVEAVDLSPSGEAAGPIRRVSPDRGHVVSFDLVREGGEVFVVAQDEAAYQEHAGSRVVRYPLAEKGKGEDLVDAGVGRALSEIVEVPPEVRGEGAADTPKARERDGGVTRWLAWTDAADH
ncbi:MAG TPA: hypothetical protein VIF62_22915, partial [Labilithrix sp.]